MTEGKMSEISKNNPTNDRSSLEGAAPAEAGENPLVVEMRKNTLAVNGNVLEPSDGVETLLRALTEDREQIIAGLEEYRRHIQEQNPDVEVSLAAASVMRLGFGRKEAAKILTARAMHSSDNVFRSIEDIKEEYRPFWEAVVAAGFVPQVRNYNTRAWNLGLDAKVPPEQE